MAASIIPCTYTFPSPYTYGDTYGGLKKAKKFLEQQFKEHLTVAPHTIDNPNRALTYLTVRVLKQAYRSK